MEATYVNTGHPDFIGGHRAMALVQNRIEAAKPQQPGPGGKGAPAALNNGKDMGVDLNTEQQGGFFGSFFKTEAKSQAARKKAAAMEAVSERWLRFHGSVG